MHRLAVKLEGIERRKRTTGLLHIAAGCYLLVKSIGEYQVEQQTLQSMLLFIIAGVISVIYGVMKKFLDANARLNRWIRLMQVCVFTLLAIDFISFGSMLEVVLLFGWAIGCLLLMFTERKVFHDAEMLFGRDGIFIPGYFTNRRLFWTGIKEVVVRPDFITIFQNNETYLQYEVLKNMDATDLQNISVYCIEQITSAGKPAKN